jgi:hypothetical protein
MLLAMENYWNVSIIYKELNDVSYDFNSELQTTVNTSIVERHSN